MNHRLSLFALASFALVACKMAPSETDRSDYDPKAAAVAAPSGKPPSTVRAAPDDPLKGKWTLAEATKGLEGKGTLVATIETNKGSMRCKLYDDKAPITVANFVGLVRGLRPWKDAAGWVTKPAYDGTTFHRVIDGFMIQGGDPRGNGSGEPGYVIPDEIWAGAKHDRVGQLCMANRGPDTNGQQFFITDAPAANLDGGYTIFGECAPEDVIHTIAKVPRDGRDKPKDAVTIASIKISRG